MYILQIERHRNIKTKRSKEIHHANTNSKQAAAAISISDKVDFRTTGITC